MTHLRLLVEVHDVSLLFKTKITHLIFYDFT